MQTPYPSAAGHNEPAVAVITLCLSAVLCWLYFADLVRWSCWLLYWLWRFTDFPQIHHYAAQRINLLAMTGNGATTVSVSTWLAVMNGTAHILLVPCFPLLMLAGWGVARHPALGFHSRRWLTIHTLPRVMVTFAPSVIPVLSGHKGDGLMNDTTPENAWALTPEDFAAQHGLVGQRLLDREAARAIFDAQTGPAMTPPDQWQPHERALLAVFGLQVFADDRAAASTLLDGLNRSCLVRRPFRAPVFRSQPDWSVSEAQVARVLACAGVSDWLATHGTVRSALAGLYGRDLRLPPARFRWLKGIDRTLWYGLQTAGAAKVFVEGAGIVAQARAEQQACRLGLPRPPLMTDQAVAGLRMELETLGLIHARDRRPPRPHPEHDTSSLDALYRPQDTTTVSFNGGRPAPE